MSTIVFYTSYPAKIAHLIQSIVAFNVSPFLVVKQIQLFHTQLLLVVLHNVVWQDGEGVRLFGSYPSHTLIWLQSSSSSSSPSMITEMSSAFTVPMFEMSSSIASTSAGFNFACSLNDIIAPDSLFRISVAI